MTQMVEEACEHLRRIIEAAQNANQAGEEAVVQAAAASDMLEALKAVSEKGSFMIDTRSGWPEVYDQVDAAIAKAEPWDPQKGGPK